MKKLNQLKELLNYYNIDGYIVPKNDEFFCEYTSDNKDKLKFISNFSGSSALSNIDTIFAWTISVTRLNIHMRFSC